MYEALGDMVTEARNLLDTIKGGAIRTMQMQFDALIATFQGRVDKAVAEGQTTINGIIATLDVPGKTYQQLLHLEGKVFGHHKLMTVEAPGYLDPAAHDYRPEGANGIVLWKIGAEDDVKIVHEGLGFVGFVKGTRSGNAMESTGCEVHIMRQYNATLIQIDDTLNSMGLRVGEITHQGQRYQTLCCDYPMGGSLLLDGFASLQDCEIKDANFGRYINDKAGVVHDRYAPIAKVQY